jgi:FlaG/FlaF family flagellin (archaellin)
MIRVSVDFPRSTSWNFTLCYPFQKPLESVAVRGYPHSGKTQKTVEGATMAGSRSAELTFNKEAVNLEQIHLAVDEVVRGLRPGGCTTCGLGGWDITLRGVDPGEFENVAALTKNPGVLSIGISE